jgi:putative endonuclease
MYYLYIIQSEIIGKYYVGVTEDCHRRLMEHNTSDRDTYTKRHRPWQFAAVFSCGDDYGIAREIENFIKKQKSKVLIEKMINGCELTGKLAHLVRVPYERH